MSHATSTADFDPNRLDLRDPALIDRLMPRVERFIALYLRPTTEGFADVPRGPAMFVANHSGGIADPSVVCTLIALWRVLGTEAPLYALAHDFAMRQFRPFGRLVQRFGALRATPDNARRVLERGGQVLVYPGGVVDAFRHTRRRDEVVFGSRVGFVRVAQETGVPIVPIVAHGAHRSAFIFHEGRAISRWLKLPERTRTDRFPLALALPWGLTLGPWLPYFPLPFAIQVRALPAISVNPSADPHDVREHVRAVMQRALDELAARKRKS